MKILLLGEYSGLNNELKKALAEYGHQVTLAAANDFFKKYPTDINLGHGENILSYKFRQLYLPFFHLKKLSGFDVVHVINFYIFPKSPYLNLFLVNYLKENNRFVTLSGAGDDPFFVKYSTETMRYSPIPWHEKYDRGGKPYYMRKKVHLDSMHKYMNYIDRVIPIMYEYYSTFCMAGYQHKTSMPIPIPIGLDEVKYMGNVVRGGRLVFFHGLNRPGFKGTFLIKKSFDFFSKKYPSQVKCIIDGKMSFSKYLELLSSVNISLDQVFSYSLSMNSLYSMAQGKVVCGGAEKESSILYNGSLPPVYNLMPDCDYINDLLEHILENKSKIPQISEASREFVGIHHDPKTVALKYTECWKAL